MPNENLRGAIIALDNELQFRDDPVSRDMVHLLDVLSEMEVDEARKAIRRALTPGDARRAAEGLGPVPATHEELEAAVASLGFTPSTLRDGYVGVGVRAELDETYAGLLGVLGLIDLLEDGHLHQVGRQIGQEVKRQRQRRDQAQAPTVVGLAGLGDLDDEDLTPANGCWDGVDEDEDEDDGGATWRPEPVDLVVTVRTTTATVARNAVELVLPALRAEGGAFVANAPVAIGDSTSVTLTADGDQRSWLTSSPPAQVVLETTVEVMGLTVPVAVRVAGEPDPDRPPRNSVTETNQMIARMAEDGVIQARPERIMLELTRIDGRPFSEDQAREPLNKAVRNLAANLGPIRILDQMADVEPHVRLATISLEGDGELDPRSFAHGLVRFTGTLPFEGIGMVRVRVRTGAA